MVVLTSVEGSNVAENSDSADALEVTLPRISVNTLTSLKLKLNVRLPAFPDLSFSIVPSFLAAFVTFEPIDTFPPPVMVAPVSTVVFMFWRDLDTDAIALYFDCTPTLVTTPFASVMLSATPYATFASAEEPPTDLISTAPPADIEAFVPMVRFVVVSAQAKAKPAPRIGKWMALASDCASAFAFDSMAISPEADILADDFTLSSELAILMTTETGSAKPSSSLSASTPNCAIPATQGAAVDSSPKMDAAIRSRTGTSPAIDVSEMSFPLKTAPLPIVSSDLRFTAARSLNIKPFNDKLKFLDCKVISPAENEVDPTSASS